MSRATIENLITELAREWTLPDLAMDENDYLCIQTETGVFINIDFFEEADQLSFYTTVAEVSDEVSPENRLKVHRTMLEANSGWEETSGATLALDSTGTLALLTVAMPVEGLDLPAMRQRVEDFAKLAWHWSKRIKTIAAATPEPGSEQSGEAQVSV